MPKKKLEPYRPQPVVQPIVPNAVYTLDAARLTVGVAEGCLPREIRLGRLQCARRGGKVLILGKWLLAWIKAGTTALEKAPAEPMATAG